MMRLPEELKEELQRIAVEHDDSGGAFPLTKGMMGAIVGTFNKACGGDIRRHQCLMILFGKKSTHELTGGEWLALAKWVDVQKVGDDWLPQGDFQDEVECLLGIPPVG